MRGNRFMKAIWREDGYVLEMNAAVPDLAALRQRFGWLHKVDSRTWLDAMPANVVKAANHERRYGKYWRDCHYPPALIRPRSPIRGPQAGIRSAPSLANRCLRMVEPLGEALHEGDTGAAKEAERVLKAAGRWPIFKEMSKEAPTRRWWTNTPTRCPAAAGTAGRCCPKSTRGWAARRRDSRCGQVGDPGVVDVGGGRAVPISTDRFVWPNACSEVRDTILTCTGYWAMRASAWVVDGGVGLALLYLATLTPTAVAQDAYVADGGSNSVSVVNTKINRVVGRPIKVGGGPSAIAITPNGRTAYVANETSGNVSVIDTKTNRVVDRSIRVAGAPCAIAISPDGKTAYVANPLSGVISTINTKTNRVVGLPIRTGRAPSAIAITPDGTTAFAVNTFSDRVFLVDTDSERGMGSIVVGTAPGAIAITPDGSTAYVTNADSNNVSVVENQTQPVLRASISVGLSPSAIAITGKGTSAYVTNGGSNSVSVIDTQTNEVAGSPISVGRGPSAIAFIPQTTTAYVTNELSNTISVIDSTANRVVGSPIRVGPSPDAIAIAPNRRTA